MGEVNSHRGCLLMEYFPKILKEGNEIYNFQICKNTFSGWKNAKLKMIICWNF